MPDIAFGWDATAGVVEDWMYDKIADTYLLDAELRSWIKENEQVGAPRDGRKNVGGAGARHVGRRRRTARAE